jgi:hypothetical protein
VEQLCSSADDCSTVFTGAAPPTVGNNVLSAKPPTTWKLPSHVTPTHL